MKPEHDKELCEKYPKIFKDRHASMQHTAMCWGFECGDGWYQIIDNLCSEIQSHIDSNSGIPQVVATQVKEKFGGLRFYVYGGDDKVHDLIDAAMRKSQETCDVCGQPGKINNEGWLSCRCPEHNGTVPE